jgi:uncharacterized membrane protein HdeD (DUF308 family)
MSFSSDGFVGALLARWWVWMLRGSAAILFGILAFAAPASSLAALVMLWGAYAVLDGVFALVIAARRGRAGLRWGWMFFEGLVGIAAGVGTFAWPAITGLVLLAFIAAWAVLTGVAEIAAAIALRRELRGEWLLGASGALSVAFGALLLVRPEAGALAIAWMIGAYALVFGVLLVAFGLRLNRLRRTFAHVAGVGSPT